MSLKGRKLSLDSSIALDLVLGGQRGSRRFSFKKSTRSTSPEDAPMQIQELNNNFGSEISSRKQNMAEENGLLNNNSFIKHSKIFHKLFQEIPEEENLIHTFTCALQKEVLYHGKLFVSENHVCFNSSVLLKDTKVMIPVANVTKVKKQNSALSMLSVQTADGEKYSFVSLRNREMCYKLLQTVCSNTQAKSANSRPPLSSAENEADYDVASSCSSFEDSFECDLSRENGVYLGNSFTQMSLWVWRIMEKVTPFFLVRGIRTFHLLFYLFMVLMVLLLLTSGYIGLRIKALEEQLSALGAQAELSLTNKG